MSKQIHSVKDMLAVVTADMDQAQATINEARSKFSNDALFQAELDLQQVQLDLRRERAKIMKHYADRYES